MTAGSSFLTGLFMAGAVAFAVGLVSTLLGRPVGLGDVLLFFAVACGYPAWAGLRWAERQYEWDAERLRRVWIENEARAVALEQARVQPAAAPESTDAEQAAAHRAHLWRVMAHRFVVAGDQHGFGVRVLGADNSPHKITTWDGWQVLVNVLCEARILTASKAGTRWAAGWDRARWDRERTTVQLPYPDNDPPDVLVTPQHHTTPHATTAATAASGD